jgi:L-rhamnose mutarotase
MATPRARTSTVDLGVRRAERESVMAMRALLSARFAAQVPDLALRYSPDSPEGYRSTIRPARRENAGTARQGFSGEGEGAEGESRLNGVERMRSSIAGALLALAAAGTFLLGSVSGRAAEKASVKRVGMVVGLKPETIEEYKRLHADDEPGVRDLLSRYNMRNFSIFLQEIDGKWYEFGYYEYTGDDFEGDMARLAKEPRNIEWLKLCDPMQLPLPGADGWTEMERVYFNP